MIEAAAPTNWTGLATMLGAFGTFLTVIAKIVSDWAKERTAKRERLEARAVQTATAVAVGAVATTQTAVSDHLDKQDETLDKIHVASNSNLAASEERTAASEERTRLAEEKIQKMADDAVRAISDQMVGLKEELTKRDAVKAEEQRERDRHNGYDDPPPRKRRPPNRRR